MSIAASDLASGHLARFALRGLVRRPATDRDVHVESLWCDDKGTFPELSSEASERCVVAIHAQTNGNSLLSPKPEVISALHLRRQLHTLAFGCQGVPTLGLNGHLCSHTLGMVPSRYQICHLGLQHLEVVHLYNGIANRFHWAQARGLASMRTSTGITGSRYSLGLARLLVLLQAV